MLLAIELLTLAFFLLSVAHAVASRGREGIWLMGSLLALGFLRENLVALYKILYAFAPLQLMLGAAPLIGTIIWGYSIYAAIVWAEAIGGSDGVRGHIRARDIGLASLFMIALVFFYEPFLKLIGMARWEDGTRWALGVPAIALIGYPTLTALFLLAWRWVARREAQGIRRFTALAATLGPVAAVHAFGLQALKNALDW